MQPWLQPPPPRSQEQTQQVAKSGAKEDLLLDSTSPSKLDVAHIENLFEEGLKEAFGREKAAKNDDVGTDTEFWDRQVVTLWWQDSKFQTRWAHFSSAHNKDPCSALHAFLLQRWWSNFRKSFCKFMRQELSDLWWQRPTSEELVQEWAANITAGRDCITHAVKASWWDWEHGSRLFFWRWSEESRKWAWDGHPFLPRLTAYQPTRFDNPQNLILQFGNKYAKN